MLTSYIKMKHLFPLFKTGFIFIEIRFIVFGQYAAFYDQKLSCLQYRI